MSSLEARSSSLSTQATSLLLIFPPLFWVKNETFYISCFFLKTSRASNDKNFVWWDNISVGSVRGSVNRRLTRQRRSRKHVTTIST